MKDKKLSVVMSAYQRAHTVGRAIGSLMSKEIIPDEIIIVDDGSTDCIKRVVSLCQKIYPEGIIKYYYNNNPGWTICVHGMNCAIKLASHEIIMTTMPEILHASEDVKIIKDFFRDSRNDKTFLIGRPLYEMCGMQLFYSLTEKNFTDLMSITKLPCVNEWYQGFETHEDTITYFPNGGLHHIAGILKKDLIAIGGYDEEFLSGGAGGYDDIDLISRFGHYGKVVKTDKMVAIHLPHEGPPLEAKNPAIVNKNFNRMQSRSEKEWKVNIGKKWGVLKK